MISMPLIWKIGNAGCAECGKVRLTQKTNVPYLFRGFKKILVCSYACNIKLRVKGVNKNG